jgi:hypothetical protein
LQYNGISLDYIHTQAVDDEPVWSDDGIDYLYTRRTLRVAAVVNKNVLPASPVGTEPPAATMSRIRHLLEVPRQPLLFQVAGVTLIQAPPPGKATDAKGGPFPKRLTITQIGGSETFLINYVIETYVIECPGGAAPAYLTHRWRETASIDENFYTTRTRTGRLTVRADILSNADAARGVVVPPIPNGFKRISSEYVLQEDGLALLYTFVDREVYLQPPRPATSASGTYTESTPNGGIRFAECNVQLEGAKTSSKPALIQVAILIALTKVRGPAGRLGSNFLLKAAAVRESLWENKVEVNVKAMVSVNTDRFTPGAAFPFSQLAVPPAATDPSGKPSDPAARGTAGLALVAAVFQDPCLQQAVLKTGGLNAAGKAAELRTVPAASVLVARKLPLASPAFFKTDPGGPYNSWAMRSAYQNEKNILQLPVAKEGALPVFLKLAAGTLTRVVEWTVSRAGARPKIPDPESSDPNLVLLRADITPESVELAGDGQTPVYRISGRYTYGAKDPDQVKLTGGVPPFLGRQAAREVVIRTQDKIQGLADPQ